MMAGKLPDDYFCPKCNVKATHDLIGHLRADGMPNLFVVQMAMNILFDAECPSNLLKPIATWAKDYGEKINGLNECEQYKLKLLKWRKWAGAPVEKEG